MAELNKAVNELLKGKNTEANLNVYSQGLFSLYRRMAMLRFSMNYFTLGEVLSELEIVNKKEISDAVDVLQELVEAFMVKNVSDKTLKDKAWEFRKQLIGYMETLTAYVDRFRIYEYMLNRVEYRFCQAEFNTDYYSDKFEEDIARYVLSDRDNSVINMKMSMVIGEVPMRLSQNKFFNIIENAFSLYKGSEQNSVKDFAYMIETAGTIYFPGYMHESFKIFKDAEDTFNAVDFNEITETQYKKLRALFDDTSKILEEYSDIFIMMAEVLNDICTVILTTDALSDVIEEQSVRDIICETYNAIEERISINDKAEGFFEKLEGMQEKFQKEVYTADSTLEEIIDINKEAIKNCNMLNVFENLKIASKLQSASTFANINADESGLVEADEAFVKNVYETVTDKFKTLFADCNRLKKRAVMAAVISNLPVFFNSFDEFREYVHIALTQCNDEAEKQACMSLIGLMISGE